jgi:glycosyltransferase involved in cell wall biosynthesis
MESCPRILYAAFDAVPSPKGAAVHIRETLSALVRVGQVDLMTLPGTLPGEVVFPEDGTGGHEHLAVRPPDGNFLHRALWFGDAVAERILTQRYDLVHVRSIWEGTPALAFRSERCYRLVYEVNGLPSVELRYHYPEITNHRDLLTRLRAQERDLLRGADALITQSLVSRRYLRGLGAPAERIAVIPNGVHPERFEIGCTPDSNTEGLPVVAYVGTLAPWQGLEVLIEAAALLAPRRPLRVWLIGGGRREWVRSLLKRARRLGIEERVELLGTVSPCEVPRLLAEARVCVAPLSLTERNVRQGCCPIKLLEYMAASKPIVAPRLPVVRELLTDGETAVLYKPEKPARLAEALERILADPEFAAEIGRKARIRVQEAFTWAQHGSRLQTLYRELLAQPGLAAPCNT